MLNTHFLSHQPQQEINIKALPEQQDKLVLRKWGKNPFGKFFPFYWNNADGRIFRDATAK